MEIGSSAGRHVRSQAQVTNSTSKRAAPRACGSLTPQTACAAAAAWPAPAAGAASRGHHCPRLAAAAAAAACLLRHPPILPPHRHLHRACIASTVAASHLGQVLTLKSCFNKKKHMHPSTHACTCRSTQAVPSAPSASVAGQLGAGQARGRHARCAAPVARLELPLALGALHLLLHLSQDLRLEVLALRKGHSVWRVV